MREAVEFDRNNPATVYDISTKPIGQVCIYIYVHKPKYGHIPRTHEYKHTHYHKNIRICLVCPSLPLSLTPCPFLARACTFFLYTYRHTELHISLYFNICIIESLYLMRPYIYHCILMQVSLCFNQFIHISLYVNMHICLQYTYIYICLIN